MPARMNGLTLSGVALCLSMMLLACGGAHRGSRHAGTMPDGGTFTGVWFSPQYGEMHLIQNGATVVGRYQKEERTGRIQGGVTGDIMRFEWSEKRELVGGHPSQSKGHGYFRIAKDDQEDTWKLLGEWGTDADETGGGPWNAVKSKTRRPDISGSGGDGSGSERSPSSDESNNSSEPGSDDSGKSGSGDLDGL